MELPNYSRLLMQQLRALRKEGKFCDCSIIVGDTPHRAHKVVLGASSLIFRSLLEGTGSICNDTDLVSSQEFSCMLDMVYTGKMSPGKHNFTRIIATADSLQMFDVGNKNIDTNLMRQSTTQPVSLHQPPPNHSSNSFRARVPSTQLPQRQLPLALESV
ncbi:zinc finger and BTB domain-containing protein 40-like [Oncorhynchus masou masou]|uniref:zinc finger and BTB domain-containing protein 40-like n=1 Tax=Oncorhynchus masou masou TaxID=90313 RepID=UPI0031838DCE